MIDPIEAVVVLAKNNGEIGTLVGSCVAGKHQFGSGWSLGSRALTFRADGGPADLYTERHTLRFEARCYGGSQPDAMAVYLALVGLTRSTSRVVVSTTQGDALIYWLVISSGPSLLYDPDINVDYVLTFLEAAVAEGTLS